MIVVDVLDPVPKLLQVSNSLGALSGSLQGSGWRALGASGTDYQCGGPTVLIWPHPNWAVVSHASIVLQSLC